MAHPCKTLPLLLLAIIGCQENVRLSPERKFQLAVAESHPDFVLIAGLVEEGVDPNLRFPWGDGSVLETTAIHVAVTKSEDQCKLVKLLLKLGASADSVDGNRNSVLHSLAKRGYLRDEKFCTFDLFMAAGVCVNSTSVGNETPLFDCARTGQVEFAERLIAEGADVNHQSNSGWTASHVAASYRHPEMLSLLKTHGADFSIKTKQRETVDYLIKKWGTSVEAEKQVRD